MGLLKNLLFQSGHCKQKPVLKFHYQTRVQNTNIMNNPSVASDIDLMMIIHHKIMTIMNNYPTQYENANFGLKNLKVGLMHTFFGL
jgi:hypothetical protein